MHIRYTKDCKKKCYDTIYDSQLNINYSQVVYVRKKNAQIQRRTKTAIL